MVLPENVGLEFGGIRMFDSVRFAPPLDRTLVAYGVKGVMSTVGHCGSGAPMIWLPPMVMLPVLEILPEGLQTAASPAMPTLPVSWMAFRVL